VNLDLGVHKNKEIELFNFFSTKVIFVFLPTIGTFGSSFIECLDSLSSLSKSLFYYDFDLLIFEKKMN
jgi:hypothetical protein